MVTKFEAKGTCVGLVCGLSSAVQGLPGTLVLEGCPPHPTLPRTNIEGTEHRLDKAKRGPTC